jgi:hypothetical protein
MNKKRKVLHYRRAVFPSVEEATPHSLEVYLRNAHKKLKNVEDRRIQFPTKILEGTHFKDASPNGFYIHFTSYTPGDKTSIINITTGVPEGKVNTTTAPKDSEFMDGDVMLFVKKNHVLICSTSLHENQTEQYLRKLLEAAGSKKRAKHVTLRKIGNIDKIRLIMAQGVKAVGIDASLYHASIMRLNRDTATTRKNILFSVSTAIADLFAKDQEIKDAKLSENINTEVLFSLDGRKKREFIAERQLRTLANTILAESDKSEESGFFILTKNNDKITAENIAIKKHVTLDSFGKTVFHQDAWDALANYMTDLEEGNIIENN